MGIVNWWTKELKFKNIEHFPHFDLKILTLSLMETESLCPMAPHVIAGHKIDDCANVMYTGVNIWRQYTCMHTYTL